MPFTVREKIAEIKREVMMRKKVYQRRVQAGQMTQDHADRQTNLMAEILADYEAQERAGSGEQAKLI